ncbi:MAG TPA: CRISPR-associated endonuclease Cas6 [Candidatus Cloacimonas sp.]|nr:CRISPR-associated endonuclease Cas6 [Candidatus Cloacimonas sp.]HPS60985.1 CRISPR-associated endonuclease Cas6 [Candidatus Cloacimonas sp.]
MNIRYLLVSWTDVNLEPRDIPKLRGFFVNQFPDDHIFHNHLPNSGYNYNAPQIQYRIIDQHPALLAINEGINIIKKVFLEVDKLEINGKTLVSNEREIALKEDDFGLTEDYFTYFFSSPWMALNQENYKDYNKMNTFQRNQKLKTILKNNLKTLSKAFNYWIPEVEKLNVDGWFKPLEVNFHNQPMQCFTGDFTTNFLIPEFLGIGKQSARGFGVVRKRKEEK